MNPPDGLHLELVEAVEEAAAECRVEYEAAMAQPWPNPEEIIEALWDRVIEDANGGPLYAMENDDYDAATILFGKTLVAKARAAAEATVPTLAQAIGVAVPRAPESMAASLVHAELAQLSQACLIDLYAQALATRLGHADEPVTLAELIEDVLPMLELRSDPSPAFVRAHDAAHAKAAAVAARGACGCGSGLPVFEGRCPACFGRSS